MKQTRTRFVNTEFLICHFDNGYKENICLCHTKGRAEQLLPIIARCICKQRGVKIESKTRDDITFNTGDKVRMYDVPVYTAEAHVYHRYDTTKEEVDEYMSNQNKQ